MMLHYRKLRRSYGDDDSVSCPSTTDGSGIRVPAARTTHSMVNHLSMELWQVKSRCIQSVWRSYWTRRLIFQLHCRRVLYALRALRVEPVLKRALSQKIVLYARFAPSLSLRSARSQRAVHDVFEVSPGVLARGD